MRERFGISVVEDDGIVSSLININDDFNDDDKSVEIDDLCKNKHSHTVPQFLSIWNRIWRE